MPSKKTRTKVKKEKIKKHKEKPISEFDLGAFIEKMLGKRAILTKPSFANRLIRRIDHDCGLISTMMDSNDDPRRAKLNGTFEVEGMCESCNNLLIESIVSVIEECGLSRSIPYRKYKLLEMIGKLEEFYNKLQEQKKKQDVLSVNLAEFARQKIIDKNLRAVLRFTKGRNSYGHIYLITRDGTEIAKLCDIGKIVTYNMLNLLEINTVL